MEKTILLIDDDPDDLEIARHALEKEGFHIITARDGNEGIELAQQDPPDLIISDLLMPNQDGLSTFEKLKSNSLLQGIPVIICTSVEERLGFSFSEDDMETHYGEKPAAFFSKPVDPKKLISTIQRLVG